MVDDLLRDLARACGVSPVWTDMRGLEQHVSPDTLRAIVEALGLPAESESAIRSSLSYLETATGPGTGSRFITARVGERVILPLDLRSVTQIEIAFETGGTRVVTVDSATDGHVVLPPFEETGYHLVRLPDGDVTVAVAPARCLTFADLSGGRAGWGLAAQIYALRTPNDGGIGTFGGVSALARAAAQLGADALAVSPSHALFGARPAHVSPYSPSTRLFSNPLHADPASAFPPGMIQAAIAAAGVGEEMARLEALPQVAWEEAAPVRQKLLRALFNALAGPEMAGQPLRADFDRSLAEASALVRSHAIFEALDAHLRERDPHLWHWRDWPEACRDPESAEVRAFATEKSEEVAYQIFLQWLSGRSCGEAQRVCRDAGMAVGLIADLAIGMDGAGSHAWARQGDILKGMSVGAPPDMYAAEGQAWGLTTFSPRALALSGFAPFLETLRANLRYAGGLRIDHVMGMTRLWLVPEGASARDGAYVSYPAETLFRLLALESHRHRAIIIGEDLGVLPDGFRDDLARQGIAGLRVLRFERNDEGQIPPRHWNPGSVALTTTHDLISTAGWWAGDDLDADADPSARHSREGERDSLWRGLADAGLVQGAKPAPEDPVPVVDAAIGYVASSPCALKLIALEDALALRVQPNVPGTTTEKPNWRHRIDGEAGTLLDDEVVRDRLAVLGPPRASPEPDTA